MAFFRVCPVREQIYLFINNDGPNKWQKPEQQHVLQFLSTAEMGSFYAEPDGVDQRVDHVDQQDDREKIFH